VIVGAFFAWVQTPFTPVKSAGGGISVLTIGERLKRTNAYFVRIFVAVVMVWIAAVTVFVTGLPQQTAVAMGGSVPFLILWRRVVRRQLRCPRCSTDFRKERIAELGRWSTDPRGPAELWDACPRCGVSFNDPWP
jgi:hypothetical protein